MDSTTIAVFVAGLFLGTLLNIIVIRLPREHSLAFSRSPRIVLLLELRREGWSC